MTAGSRARRVGAIDIGTNTVLLTIAEPGEHGPRALVEKATITRLGEGVDKTGALAAGAVARTLACLESYARVLAETRVEALDVVGTSALRDARGGGDFLDSARALLGKEPRVISGDEEARLTFSGAISGLELGSAVTVFDIGGGSTEIITRGPGAELSAVSLDMGSVRLFERHLHGDPPRTEELAALRENVRAALRAAPQPEPGATLVGVAGTVTTLAAIDQALAVYDAGRVHGARLARDALQGLLERLAGLSLAARREIPSLEPGRADVIVSGAAIAVEVVDWAGATALIVSDRGVRWGLIQQLLDC